RRVLVAQVEAVSAERIQAEIYQAVILAQELQVFRSPHIFVIIARVRRINVSDIYRAERRRVLEEESQKVARLQDVPIVIAAVTEAAVLRVDDVQIPRVTRDLEVVGRSLHKAREVVELDPSADWALPQSLDDDGAPVLSGGHPALAFALLPLVRAD